MIDKTAAILAVKYELANWANSLDEVHFESTYNLTMQEAAYACGILVEIRRLALEQLDLARAQLSPTQG